MFSFILTIRLLDVSVFLEELESVHRLSQDNDSSAPPVVVQCTSGSGRTGVLILAQLMIQCLERNQVSCYFFCGTLQEVTEEDLCCFNFVLKPTFSFTYFVAQLIWLHCNEIVATF